MRENLCSVMPLFNRDQIKNINTEIKKNLINAKDNPASDAIKNSQVKFVTLFSIQKYIVPFIDFAFNVNNTHYGFDLFQLTANKILNYNSYNVGEEYSWHIDADMKSPIRDVKLTCLLNLSEEKYDGGDLYLFNHKEVKVENFEPGSAVVFPSFLNHRVSEILKGSRNTLAIWMWGPKFR